jgi:2-oxoglutarate ferredoxin oxidoreductase subunit gamma
VRYELRFSGAGGQGLILIGKILAEAAAIYEGKNATQSQSYGPEARGGASRSEVIISDDLIDFPKATRIDCLLALTQEACDKYWRDLKDDGMLIVDSDAVTALPPTAADIHSFPFATVARETVGRELVANLVALGLVVALTRIVSPKSVESAVLSRVPRGTEEMNLKAFRAGLGLAESA